MFAIPLILRVVLPALLVAALLGWVYQSGVSRESDRRDAQALKEKEKADAYYETAATAAVNHAMASMEWKRKAEGHYRKWQEKLNDVPDSQLSECVPEKSEEKPGAPGGCILSPGWVGMYNDSWFPDGLPADPGRIDAVSGGAGAATPREALVNVRTNAKLCAEDRKRQRELIDLLQDLEAARARTNN